MSASEPIPRSPKALSIRGPTPGSSVTGLARRSVRVVRTGRTSPRALEVGNAIGPEAYVRTYDTTDLRDELLLDPEPFGQFGEELGSGDVPEVEGPSGLRGRPYLLDDRRHLPLATAGPFERNDLSLCHLQYGPDIEGGAEKALRPSDAPALGQIFQRTDGEQNSCSPDSPLRGVPDLVEIPTLVDTAQALQQDQARSHLGAPGVQHVDGTVDHPSRLHGGVVGAAELAGEGQHEDVVVVGESFVGLDEGPRGGLRRRRENVGVAQPLVEFLVGHIYLVRVRLVGPEVECERYHPDVGPLQDTGGQARGRVGNYRCGHSATSCRG